MPNFPEESGLQAQFSLNPRGRKISKLGGQFMKLLTAPAPEGPKQKWSPNAGYSGGSPEEWTDEEVLYRATQYAGSTFEKGRVVNSPSEIRAEADRRHLKRKI
jgi:hypothetical protein